MPASSPRSAAALPFDTIGDTPLEEVRRRLRSDGLSLDYGTVVVRVRSPLASFAAQVHEVYRNFPLAGPAAFSDIHVDLHHPGGLRRFVRPQVVLTVDDAQPFEPFPADSALPLFEWGVNWYVSMRMNQHLLLHAGVVAREGRAAILAALPGSGKSTLTAALMLSGYRLLSDEFGVLNLDAGTLQPLIKPVALKNRSIDVIRAFSPLAHIGPVFPKTRKGDVAHVAPDAASVAGRSESASPALILFPRFEASASLDIIPAKPAQAFTRLAFNSFNYGLLGADAFHAVADLAETCPAYELVYGTLEDAIARVGELLEQPSPVELAEQEG